MYTKVCDYWSIAWSRTEKHSLFIPFCFGGNIFCELSLPIFPTIFGISLPLQIILSSFVSDGDRLLFTMLLLLFKLLSSSISFLLAGTSVVAVVVVVVVIESLVFVPTLHELLRFCTFCANCSQCSLLFRTPFTSGCSLSDNVPKACQSNHQLAFKFNYEN